MPPQPVASVTTTGRRAQQKASTRAAITTAAQRLIARRGFDDVKVGDIAKAATVSHRTFYRYFPSKEAAFVADFQDFIDAFVSLVASRPTEEHPIDSLLATVDTIAVSVPLDADSFNWVWELIEREPALAGVQHRLLINAQDRMTTLFATRLGVSSATLEPRILAAGATAAYQAAVRTWVLIPAAERTTTIWQLGREAIQRFAGGLDVR